ncbi:conserved hypothetical protein [gamma proteobacterium NOR5-3]|nr:conserved hypothetical protein [gamma proteobacterium NOR5-3]
MLRFPSSSRYLLAFSILFASLNVAANVDRVELTNGSIIIGTFHDADDGKIVIDTDFAGRLTIDKGSILSMDVNSPVTLQMNDGTVYKASSLVVDNQTLSLQDSTAAPYALDELLRINPEPWELGKAYRHTGQASTAFSLQRGNTVLDELDYRVDSRWRGLKDRFTLNLEGEVREANRERTAENWMITGKYDRFQTGAYYWGVSASAEENRFADLDLRTTIGPYVGRSFLIGTPFELELETGLSQVNENFGSDVDREYLGLTWSVRSESQYFGTDSRLYLNHKGVKNLADRNNLILNTTVGLAFPLLGQIQGATEVVLDYNSGAVEGTKELDQTYRFRVGYNW